MKHFINPILLIIFFLHHAGVSFGQPEARKYPDWVYVPKEKRGMVSAIAYAFGDNQFVAMENVTKKVTRQLYTHLSNTILALTTLETESQSDDSCVIQFRNAIIAQLTEETIQTQRREMYIGEEDGHYKAIVLIDTPIAEFAKLILKFLETAELSPKSKKILKKRVRNMTAFIKEASQMTPALH